MLCNADIVKKARRTLTKKGSGCKSLKPPSLKSMGQPFGEVKDTIGRSSGMAHNSPPGPSKMSTSQGRNINSSQKAQSSAEVFDYKPK